jgi:hypothetical protein
MYPEEQGFGTFTWGAQSEHLFTWNEGYINKGREMGRSVYEQPGNEADRSCHSKEGFQVSKGE